MEQHKISRRDFVKTVGMGTTALAFGLPASSYRRILGANDRVRVGIIGFSERGRDALFPSFLHHAAELNFEIVGLSDLWRIRREEGAAFFKAKLGRDIPVFRNNEELFDAHAVDAVIISTADFQHARLATQAVQAGCDVYVEKPFANTMEDASAALKAVTESRKVVQVGTQRRSAPNYIAANEFIRSGRFGEIVAADITWNVNQPGRWRRPKLVEMAREQDIDWKRFLLNRPYEPFDPRKYVEYRLFWPYSSGIPCQWMVHQIDIVHWYTDLPRPRSVVANGGIYFWKDGRKNDDTAAVIFDYGPLADPTRGFQVIYASRMTNSAGGTKEVYFSNGGSLNLDTNKVTPEGGLTEEEAAVMGLVENRLQEFSLSASGGVVTSALTGVDDATLAHMRNWMECIRSRKRPNADIKAGYSHSVALCMTIAALHTGKRVTFDDTRQDVVVG
jgi:predicted dehydrogenase